jgi:hypothetical protein
METFVGREEDLRVIEDVLQEIRRGEGTNLCFLGVPGAGKTSLLREYISRNRGRWEEEGVIPIYISLRDLGDSPEDLAPGFVGEVLARVAFTFRADIDISELRRSETFASSASSIESPALETFLTTLRELPAGTQEHPSGVVRSAFAFPNAFAEEKRIRLILFVDDFDTLKKYATPAMSAYAEFHEALSDQTEAFYVTAMTHSPFADKILLAEDGILRDRFRVCVLPGMDPDLMQDLAFGILGNETEGAKNAAAIVARLCGGNPLVLRHLARAVHTAAPREGPLDQGAVAAAFAAELLAPLGKIYRHYLSNLHRAVGVKADYLKARSVLATLAEGREVKPAEIGKRVGIDIETTARLVGRILGSGLFRRVEENYYFDDPLFRFWAVKTDPANEQGDGRMPTEKARELADEYVTRFLKPPKAKAAKKFNFRDLIGTLKGRTVPGLPLGHEVEVTFPAFQKVKGFAFSTRQVKMYYLEGEEEFWALMIVWWNLKAGLSEMNLFVDKAGDRLDRLWFVCRGGFTEEARTRAREKGVFLSDEKDLKSLLENLT